MERAEATFRDQCTGVTWELETLHWFSNWSLAYRGGLGELGRLVPARLREAKDRGDLYAAMCVSTGLPTMVWLAGDDAAAARACSREAIARWSQKTFHVEHWWAMLGERQVDLYTGDAQAAYDQVHAQWSALSNSLLLMVQLTRLEATHLRARTALALARARPERQRTLCREVEHYAAHIVKERMPWSTPLAALLRAGMAATQGDLTRAQALLREADGGLAAAHMELYANAARWQMGRLVGGDEGRAMVERAETWMSGEGIVDRARMAAMLAPGFDAG
jgi:hypothetical protein